jgi:DNA-binding transcriptional ArsR family regulator
VEAVRAIADPVRREILDMLRDGPRTAGAIAAAFAVSRPAVSRHLRVLREHGLVRDELVGRERVYRLDPAPLAPVEAWLVALRAPPAAAWGSRFDALETEVHRTGRDRRRATTPTIADPDAEADAEEQSA